MLGGANVVEGSPDITPPSPRSTTQKSENAFVLHELCPFWLKIASCLSEIGAFLSLS
jgi:hypothetical protein